MGFTPMVRYRNFTVDNLKSILSIYPDMIIKIKRSEAVDIIESNFKGYKKTAYQYACQLGIEDRSDENYRIHSYLYSFDDEYLKMYLEFWFKIYFAPNPFVKGTDRSINIFVELAKEILRSENNEIKYDDFFDRRIGGTSKDILKNVIEVHANPIQLINKADGDYCVIDESLKGELNEIVGNIEKSFPIPTVNDKKTFFERFSYENFAKFFNLDIDKKQNINPQKVNKIVNKERNRLIYGSPGTGKSKFLENESIDFGDNYERVTFYEDYSYAQFVGSYKPVSDNGEITYKFVAGPFLRQLAKALSPKNNGEPQLLIIEEINRANAASVFGDMFQLLDRNSNGEGEYKVHISDEMKKYLMDEYGLETSVLRLPSNFYLWATMNSADQGVFPLDSAFKRRFDEYKLMDINENEGKIEDIIVDIKCNGIGLINWNMFRHVLNDYLLEKGVKDDKLIGPFFIKRSILEDKDKVQGAIKDKLLMYLLEDVVKRNRGLFEDNAKSLNKINILYGNNNGENVIFAQDFMDMLNEVVEAGDKNETD